MLKHKAVNKANNCSTIYLSFPYFSHFSLDSFLIYHCYHFKPNMSLNSSYLPSSFPVKVVFFSKAKVFRISYVTFDFLSSRRGLAHSFRISCKNLLLLIRIFYTTTLPKWHFSNSLPLGLDKYA